jgi:hypothetical protein
MPATFSFILYCLVALVVLLLPGLALLHLCLNREQLSFLSRVTIAPGISVAFVTLLLTWFHVCGLPFGSVAAWFILGASFLILILRKSEGRWRIFFRFDLAKSEQLAALTLSALLLLLLFVRLHATRDCVVPPGIDSAQHTVIVQLLRDHHGLFQSWMPYDAAETFTYHIGFHSVTALFAWITRLDSAYAVFIMARTVGLCAAASLFALVRLWTRSDWGGVFAVALWELYSRQLYFFDLPGRWTLLTGLVVLPCALVLFDLFLTQRDRSRLLLGSLCAVVIAGLVLAQYKSALIFVVLAASLICARSLSALLSKPNAQTKEVLRIMLGSVCLAIIALFLAAPRLHDVLGAKTGHQLKRIVVEGPAMNPHAFGAPQLRARDILRTGFSTPQKIVASSLAMLVGIVVLLRRRAVIWFFAGWLVLTVLMNPTLIGIDRIGLIDEIHWKGTVQTAIAALAGLAVGLLCETITPRRAVVWNIALMCAALVLAIFGALRLPPIPTSSRFVLPDDLRLLSWMKDHVPPNEKIAARSFFDHGHVQGYDAGIWLPYFARRQTNQTSLAADLEIAPARENDRQFTRELYQRDMSTPESAHWMRKQGFSWFFVGGIQPEIDARLLEQLAQNAGLELVHKENAALLYRVR